MGSKEGVRAKREWAESAKPRAEGEGVENSAKRQAGARRGSRGDETGKGAV